MPSTYSSRLKLELQATGENPSTWGDKTNNNLDVLDAFSGGYLSKSVAGSANVTLTTANASATSESSNKVIEFTGELTDNITVFVPEVENNYLIYNNTTGSFTLTVAATNHGANGVAITQGKYGLVYVDGASNYNVENALTKFGDISVSNVNVSVDANVTGNVNVSVDANVTGNVNVSGTINSQAISAAANISTTANVSIDEALSVTGTLNANGSVIFNEPGASTADVRMESDGQTHMFFLDASANAIGIGNSSPTASLTVANNAVAEQGTLTDGATITPDLSTKNNFTVTLGGNRTLAAPTNSTTGQCGYIRIVQDGTGGRTLTFNSAYKFINGTDLDMSSAAASSIYRLDYVVISSTEIHVNGTGPYS